MSVVRRPRPDAAHHGALAPEEQGAPAAGAWRYGVEGSGGPALELPPGRAPRARCLGVGAGAQDDADATAAGEGGLWRGGRTRWHSGASQGGAQGAKDDNESLDPGGAETARSWWPAGDAQIHDKRIQNIYICLCHGLVPPQKRWTITARLCTNGEETVVEQGLRGEPATTHVDCLAHFAREGQRYSLCKVEIGTSKTHQIRVHMAHRGNPLVSDFRYNADHLVSDLEFCPRVFLHAWQIGSRWAAIAPLPPDLRGALAMTTLEADWTWEGQDAEARRGFEEVLAACPRGPFCGDRPRGAQAAGSGPFVEV